MKETSIVSFAPAKPTDNKKEELESFSTDMEIVTTFYFIANIFFARYKATQNQTDMCFTRITKSRLCGLRLRHLFVYFLTFETRFKFIKTGESR